jgi:hypothetical protein
MPFTHKWLRSSKGNTNDKIIGTYTTFITDLDLLRMGGDAFRRKVENEFIDSASEAGFDPDDDVTVDAQQNHLKCGLDITVTGFIRRRRA